jgi:hypothetical protein
MKRLLLVWATALAVGPLAGALAPVAKAKLVFVSARTGRPQLFLINPDGTGAENLTNHPSLNGFPAWSPAGRKIAFNKEVRGTDAPRIAWRPRR